MQELLHDVAGTPDSVFLAADLPESGVDLLTTEFYTAELQGSTHPGFLAPRPSAAFTPGFYILVT